MDHALIKEIRDILLKDWDPIGMQDILEAQDEYSTYVFPLYQLLKSRKTEEEIFNYLWWIETEHMGLRGCKSQTLIIAKKLHLLN